MYREWEGENGFIENQQQGREGRREGGGEEQMMWREVDRLNEVRLEADEGESGRIKIYLKGLFHQTGWRQIALQTKTREVLFLLWWWRRWRGAYASASSSSPRPPRQRDTERVEEEICESFLGIYSINSCWQKKNVNTEQRTVLIFMRYNKKTF